MIYIRDIMTTELFALHPTQNLAMVRFLIELKHIRHIPIVDEHNVFVGLLTHRDLLACTISMLADIDESEQVELEKNIPIVDVMTTDVITVSPSTSLADAIQILLDHKYGCLPVLDEGGRLVGLVTEADFMKLTKRLLESEMI